MRNFHSDYTVVRLKSVNIFYIHFEVVHIQKQIKMEACSLEKEDKFLYSFWSCFCQLWNWMVSCHGRWKSKMRLSSGYWFCLTFLPVLGWWLLLFVAVMQTTPPPTHNSLFTFKQVAETSLLSICHKVSKSWPQICFVIWSLILFTVHTLFQTKCQSSYS